MAGHRNIIDEAALEVAEQLTDLRHRVQRTERKATPVGFEAINAGSLRDKIQTYTLDQRRELLQREGRESVLRMLRGG